MRRFLYTFYFEFFFISTCFYYLSLSSTMFVERVSLLLILWEVPFSDLGPKTVRINWCYLVFIILAPNKSDSITGKGV